MARRLTGRPTTLGLYFKRPLVWTTHKLHEIPREWGFFECSGPLVDEQISCLDSSVTRPILPVSPGESQASRGAMKERASRAIDAVMGGLLMHRRELVACDRHSLNPQQLVAALKCNMV